MHIDRGVHIYTSNDSTLQCDNVLPQIKKNIINYINAASFNSQAVGGMKLQYITCSLPKAMGYMYVCTCNN